MQCFVSWKGKYYMQTSEIVYALYRLASSNCSPPNTDTYTLPVPVWAVLGSVATRCSFLQLKAWKQLSYSQSHRRKPHLVELVFVDEVGPAAGWPEFGSASGHCWIGSGCSAFHHPQTSPSLDCAWGILDNGTPGHLSPFDNLLCALSSAVMNREKQFLRKTTEMSWQLSVR